MSQKLSYVLMVVSWAVALFILSFDADSVLYTATAVPFVNTIATLLGNLFWVYGSLLFISSGFIAWTFLSDFNWEKVFSSATMKGTDIKAPPTPPLVFGILSVILGVVLMSSNYWWTGTWWVVAVVLSYVFNKDYRKRIEAYKGSEAEKKDIEMRGFYESLTEKANEQN